MDLDISDRAGVGAMKRPSLMPISQPEVKRIFTVVFNELESISSRVDQIVNDEGIFTGALSSDVTASPIKEFTAAISLDSTHRVVLCDASGGAFTVTLPDPIHIGWRYLIKKTDSSAYAVTVAGTIDGDTNFDLELQDEVIEVVADGTAWWII